MELDFHYRGDDLQTDDDYDGTACATLAFLLWDSEYEELYGRTEFAKLQGFSEFMESDGTMNVYGNITADGDVFVTLFTQQDDGSPFTLRSAQNRSPLETVSLSAGTIQRSRYPKPNGKA